MNSFESDLKRAVISVPFIAGVIIETIILFTSGFDSDLFKVSVPVAATLPYSAFPHLQGKWQEKYCFANNSTGNQQGRP